MQRSALDAGSSCSRVVACERLILGPGDAIAVWLDVPADAFDVAVEKPSP